MLHRFNQKKNSHSNSVESRLDKSRIACDRKSAILTNTELWMWHCQCWRRNQIQMAELYCCADSWNQNTIFWKIPHLRPPITTGRFVLISSIASLIVITFVLMPSTTATLSAYRMPARYRITCNCQLIILFDCKIQSSTLPSRTTFAVTGGPSKIFLNKR